MASQWLAVFLFSLVVISQVESDAEMRKLEYRILDSILGEGRYDSRYRPNGEKKNGTTSDPVVVRANMYIRSISRIDDYNMDWTTQITFRQQWKDDRLKFDDVNGKIPYLILTDPSMIWKPDLFFSNEKSAHFHNVVMPNVLLRIFPDGSVLYSIRLSLVLFCPMDLASLPFDTQTCVIKMASYGYTTENVDFHWKETEPVQVTKNLHLPHFTLYNYTTDYCTSRTNTGEYSCLKVSLKFERDSNYYMMNAYIPTTMLVIMAWLSFWIPFNPMTARMVLLVATLLTGAGLTSFVNMSLAPTSYTKLIDIWTGTALTFIFGALVYFVVIVYKSTNWCEGEQNKSFNDRNTEKLKKMDFWARIVYSVLFVVFALLYYVIILFTPSNRMD